MAETPGVGPRRHGAGTFEEDEKEKKKKIRLIIKRFIVQSEIQWSETRQPRRSDCWTRRVSSCVALKADYRSIPIIRGFEFFWHVGFLFDALPQWV